MLQEQAEPKNKARAKMMDKSKGSENKKHIKNIQARRVLFLCSNTAKVSQVNIYKKEKRIYTKEDKLGKVVLMSR